MAKIVRRRTSLSLSPRQESCCSHGAANVERPRMIRFHAISRLDGDPLDGIHLLWSPPFPAGHSLDGFTIYRREAHRDRMDQYCFDVDVGMLADVRARGVLWSPDATIWADARDPSDPLHSTWTYRFELARRHSAVTVTAPGARAVFIGTADGAVVAGEVVSGSAVTLHASDVGFVWVVTDNPKEGMQICGDADSEGAWTDQAPIVKNLQVPFAAVNPTVTSSAAGRALASARALPELLDGDFDEVSRYADAALSRPAGIPAFSVVSERPGDGGNDWDVSPYGLALATTLLAPWRRGWGFAHIDKDGLTPGRSYDYRIVGSVRRRDRDERMYDLHTVPAWISAAAQFPMGIHRGLVHRTACGHHARHDSRRAVHDSQGFQDRSDRHCARHSERATHARRGPRLDDRREGVPARRRRRVGHGSDE